MPTSEKPALHLVPPSSRAQAKSTPSPRLRQFAWFVLGYNVLVILWGALVRATGSGAGCGNHWPLCNGQVIPQSPKIATIIEFTHRAMTGATTFLIIGLLIWIFRSTMRGHLARIAAVASTVLLVNEAFLGALLVKLGYVVQSQSPGRFIVLPIHLANTLLLLAALTLTASFLSRNLSRRTLQVDKRLLLLALLGLGASILTGVSGSLAALGDTLFPSVSLAAAMTQDFAARGSWIIRLRWVHPASALVAAIFVVWLILRSRNQAAPATNATAGKHPGAAATSPASPGTTSLRRAQDNPGAPSFAASSQRVGTLGYLTAALLLSQILIGIADVLLLAPTWMQIVHLLGADLYWIALTLLASEIVLRSSGQRAGLTH